MSQYAPSATTTGAALGRDLAPKKAKGRATQDTTPCPRCGNTKAKKAGPTGKDLSDRVLRQRKCANGHVFTTIEVALPEGVYFADVDYRYKQLQRDGNARRRGSDTTRWWSRIRPMDIVIEFMFKRDGKSVFRDEGNRAVLRRAS